MLKIKNKIIAMLMRRHENRFEKSVKKMFEKNAMKWCKLILTPEQEKEIQSFYKEHLGHRINPLYHAYYFSRNGNFSPKYVPTSIYKAKIIGRLNDLRMKDAYTDKNLYDRLFPQIKHPQTILKCINGYFYQTDIPITKEEAIRLCSNQNNAIIKPSLDSGHGNKVMCFTTQDGITEKGNMVESLLNSYGKHFIIQERVKQHHLMSALNPSSVNTIRLLTYRRQNTIEILYAVVRIGRKGEVIDNESGGGITAKIHEDGRIDDYAYGLPSEAAFEKTECGVAVKNYKVPSFEKVKDIVKTLHLQLPFFNIAGWDIAIGEDGEPVFIEWNARPELSQTAAGPAFGAFTEEILKATRTRLTTNFYVLGQRRYNDGR